MSDSETSRKVQASDQERRQERSGVIDRRKKPTNPLSWNSLFGRRREIRRQSDRDRGHVYVDRYGSASVLLFVGVLVLSIVDALFTLSLVGSGGKEINPVMDFVLEWGPLPFLAVKYFLTGGALLFILVHKEYQLRLGSFHIKGRNLFLIVLGLYVALICYELYLLSIN